MAETETVNLRVNGQSVEAVVDPDMRLLTFLREELGLVGVKNGCSEGTCGACTVIIDGEARRSCVTRMGRMDGRDVQTIEGLAQGDELHPLQYTMISENAVQCGFCTPGMVLAGKALLDRNPDPTVDEIKDALKRNLCRCTGFRPIINAVQEAGRMLRSGTAGVVPRDLRPRSDQVVGEDVARLQGVEKVTGSLHYTADLTVEGMLHVKVLRAEHPHAKVVRLDTSAAEKADGVVDVLTAKDVPGINRFGLHRQDQPVFVEDRVRFLGDVLAAVVGETEKQAGDAVSRIEVEYEPLEVVETPQQALTGGAPLVHDTGNLLRHVCFRKGDVEAGFAQAAVVVEGDYQVPCVEQAYLEPEAGLGVPTEDGVTIYVGSQGPTKDQASVAAVLGWPEERVHVVHMPMGGGFGGKEDITVQAIVALAALRTGRPARFLWTRSESLLASTKRHAEWLHYRTGAAADGRLVAAEVTTYADGGAYASVSEKVIFRSAVFSCGPYDLPSVKVDAYVAYTNNPPAGAMRGFGTPQAAFAAEVQMDRLAEALGMDPVELRLKNILEPGKATITGEVLRDSVGARAALVAVRDRVRELPLPDAAPGRRIGIGYAAAYKNVGFGGGGEDAAGAHLILQPDGTVLIRHGAMDMGQGCDTVMAQIAAQTMGIPFHRFDVHAGDTRFDPDGGATTASRQTFVTGNAVREAAVALRADLCAAVAEPLGVPPDEVALIGGLFRLKDSDVLLMTLEELAGQMAAEGRVLERAFRYEAPMTYPLPEQVDLATAEGEGIGPLQYAYCFGAQAAVVAVDDESNEVNVLRIIAAQDVGQPINPQSIRGQVEGALVMGLGYALGEEFPMERGRPTNERFAKLGLLRIDQLPELETIIITDPHPEGPFGAKGMSELPLCPTAPAVANAVAMAVGARVTSLPITADKIAAARETGNSAV